MVMPIQSLQAAAVPRESGAPPARSGRALMMVAATLALTGPATFGLYQALGADSLGLLDLLILLTFAPGGPEECLRNKDVDGNTALHYASSNGHLLVLRTLLAAGADSEVRNVWSWTPVAYSATVQAEVYFKGLVAEVERRRAARRQAEERGTGGGVRVDGDGED